MHKKITCMLAALIFVEISALFFAWDKKCELESEKLSARLYILRVNQLKKVFAQQKFYKSKEKIFAQQNNVKATLKNCADKFGIEDLKCKKLEDKKYEIKFSINSEKKFLAFLQNLDMEINGIFKIVSLKCVKIDEHTIKAKIEFAVEFLNDSTLAQSVEFTPGQLISPKTNIFKLKKVRKYLLSSILHNQKALINGQWFSVGEKIGDSTISAIGENSIKLKNDEGMQIILLGNRW